MKVRENTGAEQCLTFADGRSIMLGAGEVSRELTEAEMADPYFSKALHARRLVAYREPQPPPAVKEKKSEPEPVKKLEPEQEKEALGEAVEKKELEELKKRVAELKPEEEEEKTPEPEGKSEVVEKEEEKPRRSFSGRKSTKKNN